MVGSRKGIKNKAKRAVELMKSGKVKDKRVAMEVAGNSESSIAAHTVGRTKEYQEYLKTIDDVAITDSWKEHGIITEDTKDKRLALDIGKELVKLKERNPLTVVDKSGSMPILNMIFETGVKPVDMNDAVREEGEGVDDDCKDDGTL